ncbi:hypothetical protein M758_5G011300 [Ceratodon purpureus]|nr:hypothetical protein M758_5G011300 [Ceratodon purpureus]
MIKLNINVSQSKIKLVLIVARCLIMSKVTPGSTDRVTSIMSPTHVPIVLPGSRPRSQNSTNKTQPSLTNTHAPNPNKTILAPSKTHTFCPTCRQSLQTS